MLALALAGWLATVPVRAAASDTARIVDTALVVEPSGVVIALPPEWFGAPEKAASPTCGHHLVGEAAARLRTDPRTFGALLGVTSEWDREYSAVVDSVLPFRGLVAHLGPQPFGTRGGCFADLQFRVYVSELEPADVSTRVDHPGVDVANAFFPSAVAVHADSAGWHIDRMRWNARYDDYGGEARVDMYSHRVGERTLTLVFMYAVWTGVAVVDRDYILAHLRP